MSWDRPEPSRADERRVWARGLFVFGAALLTSAVLTSASADRVHKALESRWGSGERDASIEANPEAMEATLITLDALEQPGRSLISYEYFVGEVIFVGYAAVDANETIRWKRFGPIDIEVSRDKPEFSRPEGLVLWPRGWITDLWGRTAQVFAVGQAFASAALLLLSVWIRRP